MAEVEVIKAVDGPILRKRDYEGNPVVITRQRVRIIIESKRVSSVVIEKAKSILAKENKTELLER